MSKYVELGQSDNRDVDLTDVKLVKLLPETEQLVVEPTTEEQNFKPSAEKYFDDVRVNAIQTESITINPKTTEQTLNASNNKFYDTIYVGAVTSDIDNNIQEYNIRKGVTILGKVGNVEVDKPDQEKVVSASVEQDTIVMADTGYELAKVIIPKFDISKYAKEEIAVDINPSEVKQVLIPSNNQVYNRIEVGAIPNNYVGSSVTRVDEQTYVPTTTDIEIQANQFLSGKQTIKGDANLISENIAEGKEIFGILGTHQGGSVKFSELVDGSITEVTAQDLADVTTIRDDVFANLEITKVEIPNNVAEIGDSAFINNQIVSLTLNDGVQTIGDSAFANNPITTLTIPETVTSIGASAFGGTQITELDMTSQPNPPSVTDTTFPSSLTSIYVSYDDYDAYLSSWSHYSDKLVRGLAKPSTITVTVDNYLGELVGGASVTITGNGQTYTGTTNQNGVFTQNNLQPATYTVSVADLDGFKTPDIEEVVVEQDTQNSVTVTYLEQVEEELTFSTTFSENTPAQISAVADEIATMGMTSAEVEATYGWKIGDTISYQLSTGENVEMRIIGFNHDDKADGSGKAGITLEMKNCLSKLYSMNNTNTNSGGWKNSVMRQTTLPTIKATLPQEWQDVIKTVNKIASKGYATGVETVSDDLFLLSLIEIYVSTSYAQSGASEGSPYEYWKTITYNDYRIKKYGSTDVRWWTRSSHNNSTSSFCTIHQDGSPNYISAQFQSGVSYAFCI